MESGSLKLTRCSMMLLESNSHLLALSIMLMVIEMDKIIRIILSKEGLQVPYTHEVLS